MHRHTLSRRGPSTYGLDPHFDRQKTFVKSTEDFFERKPAARRRKIFGVHFFKNLKFFGKKFEKLTVLSGFNGFLTVFSGSTTKKSPAQA